MQIKSKKLFESTNNSAKALAEATEKKMSNQLNLNTIFRLHLSTEFVASTSKLLVLQHSYMYVLSLQICFFYLQVVH